MYIVDTRVALSAGEAGRGNTNLRPLQFMTVDPLGKRVALIQYKGRKFTFQQSATVDSMRCMKLSAFQLEFMFHKSELVTDAEQKIMELQSLIGVCGFSLQEINVWNLQ
jgi:hypothetical protein